MKFLYNLSANIKKQVTASLLLLTLGTAASAQNIWSNAITGTNPNNSNPYTTGDVAGSNVTVSGIGRGSGIAGSNASNRYNASGWSTTATQDLNDYFEFTITPNSGASINFGSLVYTAQSSASGPVNFAFRSSTDGYTANIGTPTAIGTTIDLSAFQNITAAITFRLYAWNATAATGTFSVNDFAFNASTPLPVNFSAFSAARQQENVVLQWATAMEKNVSHFEIERSRDGSRFETTGTVNARNSATGARYTYTDAQVTAAAFYYRLKIVDADGSYTYSNILSVEGRAADAIATLDANLVRNALPVSFNGNTGTVELRIVNFSGMLLQRSVVSGTAPVSMDISSLTPGMYLLQVKGQNAATTFKFVKQ